MVDDIFGIKLTTFEKIFLSSLLIFTSIGVAWQIVNAESQFILLLSQRSLEQASIINNQALEMQDQWEEIYDIKKILHETLDNHCIDIKSLKLINPKEWTPLEKCKGQIKAGIKADQNK